MIAGFFAFFLSLIGRRAVPIAAVIFYGGMANMPPDWLSWIVFIPMWILFPTTLTWNIFGAVLGFSGFGAIFAGFVTMIFIVWDVFRLYVDALEIATY